MGWGRAATILIALGLVGAGCGGSGHASAPTTSGGAFSIGLWGDTPYSPAEAIAVPKVVDHTSPTRTPTSRTRPARPPTAGPPRPSTWPDPDTGQPVANVTRVESFGSPSVGWVKVTLDTADPAFVSVAQHLVAGPGNGN